jgi:hypothetical protein
MIINNIGTSVVFYRFWAIARDSKITGKSPTKTMLKAGNASSVKRSSAANW